MVSGMCAPHATDRRGSSLIEAVIAAGLLATVLGGVLPLLTSVAVVSMTTRADLLAAHLARQRLAQLQSLTLVTGPSGLLLDESSRLDGAEPFTLGGAGLTPTGIAPLAVTTSSWADWLDEGGAWVASGTSRPDDAGFERRWGILAAGASGCVKVWAEVTPVAIRTAGRRTAHAGAVRCPWGAAEP